MFQQFRMRSFSDSRFQVLRLTLNPEPQTCGFGQSVGGSDVIAEGGGAVGVVAVATRQGCFTSGCALLGWRWVYQWQHGIIIKRMKSSPTSAERISFVYTDT